MASLSLGVGFSMVGLSTKLVDLVIYPISISGTLENAIVGNYFSFFPMVSGGSGTKTFSLSGTLPSGLTFNTSNGSISGIPTGSGIFSNISIAVSDPTGSATLSNISLTIKETSSISLIATSYDIPVSVKSSTSISLSLSGNTATEGSTVTFIATVSGANIPTGTVTFYDMGLPLSTVSLNNGVGTFNTSSLPSRDHIISVAYNGDDNNKTSFSSQLKLTIDAVINPPVNTSVPVVSGSTVSGSVLTSTTGSWTGTSLTYSYQWIWADTSTPISGATSSTYTLVDSDGGHQISCIVTASNSAATVSSTSSPTSTITIPIRYPVNTVAPTISGTPSTGSTLTASTGTWSGNSIVYTYQWIWADTSTPISGATSSTYVPVSGDVGHTINVQVTATNSYGTGTASATPTSAITAPILYPVNTAVPTISGTVSVGSTLTTTNGTWDGSGITYTYQWYWADTSTPISGATSSTYIIASTDATHTISSHVTATNTYGNSTANSAATTVVVSTSGVTFFSDTFTAADGTQLIAGSYVADTGQAYETQTGVTVDVLAKIYNGEVYNPAASSWTNTPRAKTTQTASNYYVEGVLDCISVLSGETVGITGRASATEQSLYFARYSRVVNGWQLYKTVTGTSTLLGSYSDTFTSGQRTLRLEMNGTSLKVYVDGTLRISATDSSIAGPGSPGMRIGGSTQSPTTGTHITSLKAVTL